MFPEAPVPRRIGDFQIVRRIRADGPFEVYLAKEQGPLGFQREVTLRCAKREPDDAQHAEELAREANICTRLNHPSIAKVLGFFEEDDRLVLVLEHVEGTTLANLIHYVEDETERLPDSVSAYIASNVATALAAAHALLDEHGAPTPILHRALSPGVVHIARDGAVKLGGFSLAKILDRTPDSAVALVGGVGGFVAPERIRGEPSTERSDVWALGVLAFRLFAGAKGSRHVIQAMAGRPPSLSSVREGIARELTAAIDAALHDDPHKRTISCAELARWIARVAPLEEGKRELKALMETMPEENDGEPLPLAARRRARAMERNAPSTKLAVLSRREPDSESAIEVSSVEEISKIEPLPEPPKALTRTKTEPPRPPPARVPTSPPRVQTPPPRVQTPPPPAPKIDPPKPIPKTAPQYGLDAPLIEVKGASRGMAPRTATMIGMPPQHAKPPAAKLDVLTTPAPSAAPESPEVDVVELPEPVVDLPPAPPPAPLPVIAPLTKPALAASLSRPNNVPPAPPPAPLVTAFDETTELPRVRPRRNMVPVVAAIVGVLALLALIAVVIAMTKKKPVVDEEPAVAKTKTEPTKTEPTTDQAASASSKTPPAPKPSASASASTKTKLVPPPGKKLPEDWGWLVVHGPTPGTRVFVGGRSRGEPEQVVMVPCGKSFVTLAKVDTNGKWRGWAGKGVTSMVPCNGNIAEVTIGLAP